jgi:DNA-binding HxlR family transcriptional regulator
MNTTGSLCPTVKASEILGDKWTLLVLRELFFGATRYNEFQRAIPRISPTVLSGRLKQMEVNGLLIHKKPAGQKRGEYRLTASGKELAPLVDGMARWGLRWARDQLCDSDLDAGTFMWDFHRSITPDALPDGRTVMCVIFDDAAGQKWWVVVSGETVDLCNDDPGFEVSVYLSSSLKTMAKVWLGEVSPVDAHRDKLLHVTGERHLTRSLDRWFPRSHYKNVVSQAR